MTRESSILRRVMLTLQYAGRYFRNNVGVATYQNDSRVVYGLAPGSSDIIGWTTIAVTPAHKWSENPWVWICEFEKASPCLK